MRLQHAEHGLLVLAPAKLNLFLEVLGRRTDGYHELESLLVAINLSDELLIRPNTCGQIHFTLNNAGIPYTAAATATTVPALPVDGSNLVVKAANLLRQAYGPQLGADLHLRKRIPWEAGMGGGSSDAAAALAGLNQAWKLELPQSVLLEFAAKLGSDVPFFLAQSSAAICRGRGEKLEPFPLSCPLHFVVVKPPAGLSTALVFQQLALPPQPVPLTGFVAALRRGSLASAAQRLHNRLLEPAVELSPVVAQLQHEFSRLPVLGHTLSGSGTSYFGWCTHQQQARQIAGHLRALGHQRVYVVQSVA